MKKVFVLTAAILLSIVQLSFAHPPRSLEADYGVSEGIVYIFMEHLSRDHRSHYIRKIVISVDGEEVGEKRMRQQIDPKTASLKYALEAEAGSEISIKVYCKNGGTKSTSFIVPEQEEGKRPPSSEVKKMIDASKMKKKQTSVYGSKKGVFDSKEEAYGDKSDVYKDKSDPEESQKMIYDSKKGIYESKGSAY